MRPFSSPPPIRPSPARPQRDVEIAESRRLLGRSVSAKHYALHRWTVFAASEILPPTGHKHLTAHLTVTPKTPPLYLHQPRCLAVQLIRPSFCHVLGQVLRHHLPQHLDRQALFHTRHVGLCGKPLRQPCCTRSTDKSTKQHYGSLHRENTQASRRPLQRAVILPDSLLTNWLIIGLRCSNQRLGSSPRKHNHRIHQYQATPPAAA